MDVIKIEQAKSDYQKIVSFIEDGSPLPPETDPYWEACVVLDRLGKFIADIEGAKNNELDHIRDVTKKDDINETA